MELSTIKYSFFPLKICPLYDTYWGLSVSSKLNTRGGWYACTDLSMKLKLNDTIYFTKNTLVCYENAHDKIIIKN